MPFIQGHPSYNYWLGKTRSLETNKKISEKLKGRSLSEETKKKMLGRIPWNKGKKLPPQSLIVRQKRSISLKLAYKEGRRSTRRGCINLSARGENSHFWNGGVSQINRTERQNFMATTEYRNWRWMVFERDNYTCQICFKRGGYLHADHIKPYALFPKLRLVLSNGRTLCIECHKKTTTWSGRPRVVKEVVSYA